MSLEAKIESLTAAVEALTAALTTPDRLAAAAPPAPAGKKKATSSAPAAALEATAPTSSPAASAPQPVADSTPKPAVPTMEDAKKAAINFGSKKGKDALVTLMVKYGASKLPEIQPHHYTKFIAEADALAAA